MTPLEQLSDDALGPWVRRAVALPDAPPALVHRAIGLWPAAQPTALQAARGALRRVVATLGFDSWAAGPLAAGTRSLASPTRHLLFSSMGLDVDLRVSPDGERFVLNGQILGPVESGTLELTPALAEAGLPVAPPRSAALDALGEFRLGDVPRGRYVLTLQLDDEVIELPSIEVGDTPR